MSSVPPDNYPPIEAGSNLPSANAPSTSVTQSSTRFWQQPADSEPQLVLRPLNTVQQRTIEWLWKGWIPLGYITLLAGESGAGKSTVLADIAARVTTGAPWPGDPPTSWRPRGRVLWLGSEDGMEEMTAPRLAACVADLRHVLEIQGTKRKGTQKSFSMQDDILSVTKFIAENRSSGAPPVMLLVIDPITSYLSGNYLRKVDLNDAGQLRTILEPWLAVANKLRIAIVCVTHLAKDTNRSMLHRVLGSSAFVQTCRSLCAVVSRPDAGMYAKALIQVKTNLPEHPGGAWTFTTEKAFAGEDTTHNTAILATRPVWGELSTEVTAESVIGAERGPLSKYQAIFGVWLQGFFLTTPPEQYLPVSEVKQAAIDACVASARWWDDHSSAYLEKVNSNGTWMCRRKDPNKTT